MRRYWAATARVRCRFYWYGLLKGELMDAVLDLVSTYQIPDEVWDFVALPNDHDGLLVATERSSGRGAYTHRVGRFSRSQQRYT